MTTIGFLIFGALFVAYTNGANDNAKGVATLMGSGVSNFRRAIVYGTVLTFAGSLCSVFLAGTLVRNFSGKGLVPDDLAGTAPFLLAVAMGAALTVLLATLTGFPISTTHALTGALVGAGAAAVGSAINLGALWSNFFWPLLISPFIAVGLGAAVQLFVRFIAPNCRDVGNWCLCLGRRAPTVTPAGVNAAAMVDTVEGPEIRLGDGETCNAVQSETWLRLRGRSVLDVAHFLSAGAVSFARGLNDTPKIMALLVAAQALSIRWGMLLVGVAMAAGGLLQAKRVAHTMGHRITAMNPGQGLSANLVTSFLVIVASRLGVPVSTTHVSCGALFGLGAATGQGHAVMIGKIVLSWVLTLPIAAVLSVIAYLIIS